MYTRVTLFLNVHDYIGLCGSGGTSPEGEHCRVKYSSSNRFLR